MVGYGRNLSCFFEDPNFYKNGLGLEDYLNKSKQNNYIGYQMKLELHHSFLLEVHKSSIFTLKNTS
jgi:hypothetical protein